MWISRTSSAMGSSCVSLVGLDGVTETPETGGPVVVQKRAQPGHLLMVGAIEAAGAVPALYDQVRALQDSQVLGHGGPGDLADPDGDLGCRQLLGPDDPEDLPAPGLRHRLECRVHGHYVSRYLRKCQLNQWCVAVRGWPDRQRRAQAHHGPCCDQTVWVGGEPAGHALAGAPSSILGVPSGYLPLSEAVGSGLAVRADVALLDRAVPDRSTRDDSGAVPA